MQVESVLMGFKGVGNKLHHRADPPGLQRPDDHARGSGREGPHLEQRGDARLEPAPVAWALKDELLVSAQVELEPPLSLPSGLGKAQCVQGERPI